MSDIQVKNDDGTVEEFNKEDMTDEQRSLFNDVLALQKRCMEIEPMAREFSDKKQLVDLKSKSLLESLRGIGNAEKESDSETKTID
tara:strand:+ start:1718 stop:1975 length:258 start_codon:yes stop_codon:yes gene_type:complete